MAVHCHAGLGRTGVLIACYLAYSQRIRGDEAIARVRQKRLGIFKDKVKPSKMIVISTHPLTPPPLHPPSTPPPPSPSLHPLPLSPPPRPSSIQTRPQIEIVQNFASFLVPLWIFFPVPSAPLSLENLLQNQALVLHGQQQDDLKFIPKVCPNNSSSSNNNNNNNNNNNK